MLEPAFVLWGAPVTWLEIAAFALAVGCVVLSVLEIHWGWGLTILSSLLYGWLFLDSRLYGESGLQLFFVAVAVWGWWQWLHGRRRGAGASATGRAGAQAGDGAVSAGAPPPRRAGLSIARLDARGRWLTLAAWALGWPLLALLLGRFTDSDVPWLDAFPTVGSVIGQVLLGRKLLENWPVWVLVNLASVGLFAFKGLWLTAILYAVFVVLAVMGWLRWNRVAPAEELA